jgi:hypothetical protein
MLTCFESFGQVYEKIYAESNQAVQSKIDENKMNGIEILTDVISTHQIGMSGLAVSQKTALETILNSNDAILDFTISPDATSVSIVSKAIFTKENFELVLQSFNSIITGYSVFYTVQL